MLLEIAIGVAAVFAAEPVDVLAGGVHTDIGLVRRILAVFRVGQFFCVALDFRITGMGRNVFCVVLALAADGAGIVIPPGVLACLRVGVDAVGCPDLQRVLMRGAPVVLCSGVTRLLCGVNVIAGVGLDGVGNDIAALGLGSFECGHGGFGDIHHGLGSIEGHVALFLPPIDSGDGQPEVGIHRLNERIYIDLVAEPEFFQIGGVADKKARSVRYFLVGVQNEGADVVGVLQNVVGIGHDGHTGGKVFILLGIGLGLGARGHSGPLGLLEQLCFPRQIGIELFLFLFGIALAGDSQTDLQGGIILGAGADGGGNAVDGGGEGIGTHHVFAVHRFIVGAVALGGVEGQLDVYKVGCTGAEVKSVVGLHVIALPLGVPDGGAVGQQVDIAALHGFYGDRGFHLVGIACLGQVDDQINILEPCGAGGQSRCRQQGKDHCKAKQCAEQSFLHGLSS